VEASAIIHPEFDPVANRCQFAERHRQIRPKKFHVPETPTISLHLASQGVTLIPPVRPLVDLQYFSHSFGKT
jgi:hypothetical protein